MLWSTIGDIEMGKGFCSNMADIKYPCVYRRTKLAGWGVHSEKVREIGRR